VDRGTWVIDYKNVPMLREYLDERARIRKARQTGTCRKHQRKLSTAIKRAREIALLPYTLD
jgi:small subunit ribosomal protein S18